MILPIHGSKIPQVLFAILGIGFLCQCNEAHDVHFLSDSSVVSSEFAMHNWPNESTSEKGSSIISSKILISDLNSDGIMENIFISHVLNSTDVKSSIIRITEGVQFREVANFTSQKAHVLKDAIPFAFDINSDGLREIFFISLDRGKVYSLQFFNKDLKKIFIRWKVTLPGELPENFERQIKLIDHNGKKVIKIANYAIYETSPRIPKAITLP